ncbi:hypothetical protein Tco_1004200 [Tanacetum coccineum]|uniref:GAG-pre-integrase domain-containing protein n=1 Tax=Tanacetum coccineum TaxID=301880 RepID=A0ABQ5FDJ4_9ASTR
MTREKDDRPTTATGGIETNNGMNDTNVIPLPGLNPKQWETLLKMLKNQSGSIKKINGERMDGGLFYFREMPPTRAFKTTTTTIPFDLWHKRLGHPSLEVLKLLPQYPSQEMDGSVTIPVNENTMPHDDEDQVVVRILQKSQENGQSRTNTDTRTDRVHKSRGFDSKKGQKVNPWSTSQLCAKEAQRSDIRNAMLAIRVLTSFNPTIHIWDPMMREESRAKMMDKRGEQDS